MRGRDALRIFAKLGVTAPANNRLERAIQRLEAVNDAPETLSAMSDADAQVLLEANRTVFEAFVVAWTLVERRRPTQPLHISNLVAFFEGADTPSADSNSDARNIQFELVVGAHLVLGGAHILPLEPDYSLRYQGADVGLAVKRLTSTNPNTLATRLREAVGQIEGTKGVGFVAVNLDNWITDLGADSLEEVAGQFQRQLLAAHEQVAKIAARKRTLLGVLIFGTWLRWVRVDGRRRLEWREPFQFLGFGESAGEQERFDEYFIAFRARWVASMTELGTLLKAAA